MYTIDMMKKVAIVAAMHGNETYGIELYHAFAQLHPALVEQVKLIIGNMEAYDQNVRFIDADMNRQYNAGKDSYEKVEIARVDDEITTFRPDFIIDIHTTKRDSGVFFISDEPNEARQRVYDMLDIDVCIMRDEVIKSSLIGNYDHAVSLEYALKSISSQTTTNFVSALYDLITNHEPKPTNSRLYYVEKLIQKEDLRKYSSLKNHDKKPEGVALMVPADASEMDAEYYGFWCSKGN